MAVSARDMDRGMLEKALRAHVADLSDPVRFERIHSGRFNRSFLVDAGRRQLVIRVAPPRDSVFVFYERDMMRQEPGIYALLRGQTDIPVPRILAYDDTREVLPGDFLVMERLPGRPSSEAAANMDRVLRQVGSALAQAHAIHADAYGYLGEHRPMAPESSWAAAFAVMWRRLVDDVVGVGHYSDDERTRLLCLLDDHLPLFDRPVPASLLHMDIWGPNILVDDAGTVTGILDWDRALYGDPEIEFAVLDYCGVSEPAFWEGYGVARDLSAEAKVRNVFYLLYEIQKYIVICHGRNGDPAAARAYKARAFETIRRAFPR